MATPKLVDVKIVVVGAGSASFGLATLGDLVTVGYEQLAGSTVCLHDLDPDAVRRTAGVLELAMKEAAEDGDPAPFDVEATTDPREALDGATHVIVSVEHGNRMRTWMDDYYVPRALGCKQVYGENGGPGGAFHTWRQVPPLLELARQMEDSCPRAWMLNYSNPVPRVTWALSKASKIKVVGLCHGVASGLAALVSILGTSSRNLNVTSAGLNHFYWFVRVRAAASFDLPPLGPHPGRRVEAGEDLLDDVRRRGITWAEENELPLVAELLRVYGYLTYPSQSHPGEYLHWADAVCPSVKYDFRASQRGSERLRERLERTLRGEEDNYWWVHGSGERAVQIVAGMVHDAGQREKAVNLPNGSCPAGLAIDNLPPQCVVEAPATVDARGVHLEPLGPAPLGIAQLMQREVALAELVVEAAITGDRDVALMALVADPTVPSPAVARALLDEMLRRQGDLLPFS
ncbi:MAG: alpha-glucosidase/alpha-galactosidase [Promethearchaeota archaeon]